MKPYYDENRVTIYHGDCIEVLPSLAQSADAIITDPPYFLPPRQHGARGKQWPGSVGDFWLLEQAFKPVMEILYKTLKPTGQLYLHCHERSYPVFYRIAYSLWPKAHLIVWYKPTGRVGSGWRHSHELILHLAEEQVQYANGFRQDVVGVVPVRTMKRDHPAEKPGDLTDFLLEAVPMNGGTFIDPFMGSGASLVRAALKGFHCIGIDIEERYCEIAANRCRQMVMELGV